MKIKINDPNRFQSCANCDKTNSKTQQKIKLFLELIKSVV